MCYSVGSVTLGLRTKCLSISFSLGSRFKCYGVGSVTLGLRTKCKAKFRLFRSVRALSAMASVQLRLVYALSAKLSSGFLCSVRASSAMASVRLRTVYALSAKTSV